MASYKIQQTKKGLVAKINVFTKDEETGKGKIITKRIYNTDNLSEPKFTKYIEKESILLEQDILNTIKEKNTYQKERILTFAELGNEFIENIKRNLSINYFLRAKAVIAKFNAFLEQIHLNKEPISEIRVRDVQMFLNSFQSYQKQGFGKVKLKRDLPKGTNFRLLAREKIIPRNTSYDLRHGKRYITKEKALKICEFCNIDFNQFFEEKTASEQYSTETIKGYRRVLRTVFNEAVRYDWIAKNPVSQTKIGAGSGNATLRAVREKEVFSIQESKDFINALEDIDEDLIYKKIALKFLLLTGVRIAELCGLRWSDFDFTKKMVHIARSRLYCSEFGTYEKVPKTQTSIRDIPLPDKLVEDLIAFQRWFRLADDEFDDNLDKYYLVVNMYREPVGRETVAKWLDSFERKNGFKHVSCHGLRHTYCSLLLSQNVPIQTVSKYMGHSDSTITLKVYSHFIPDTQERVVNALNNII